jgi:hypothetical protein
MLVHTTYSFVPLDHPIESIMILVKIPSWWLTLVTHGQPPQYLVMVNSKNSGLLLAKIGQTSHCSSLPAMVNPPKKDAEQWGLDGDC